MAQCGGLRWAAQAHQDDTLGGVHADHRTTFFVGWRNIGCETALAEVGTAVPPSLEHPLMLASSLLVAAALSTSSAEAGGFGVLGTAGIHSDRVYYYKENAIGDFEQQAPFDQLNPNLGGGLELIIGDKDYKINGMFRFYFLQDAPLQSPESVDSGTITYNIRDTARDIGMIDAGLHFGLIGEPERLQFLVIGLIGAGFMTTDQTEFVQAQAGVGGTYTMARHVQFHAEVVGGTRYRKSFSPTFTGSAGVRYLFD